MFFYNFDYYFWSQIVAKHVNATIVHIYYVCAFALNAISAIVYYSSKHYMTWHF